MTAPYREGELVYLRPLVGDDLDTLVRLFNDTQVTRTLHTGHVPFSREREGQWLRRMEADEHEVVLGICRKDDGALIGDVGLMRIFWIDRQAVLGIALEAAHWNRGYGTEACRLMIDYAFRTLNLNRLELSVFDFNERAHHIYEKLGFVEEARLRRRAFREGAYRDEIVLGLLRREWEAR